MTTSTRHLNTQSMEGRRSSGRPANQSALDDVPTLCQDRELEGQDDSRGHGMRFRRKDRKIFKYKI